MWIMGAIVVALLAAAAIGIWYNINHGKFKPKFYELSDGSVHIEFEGVSERYSRQMERFNAIYGVGKTVEWNNRRFVVEEVKPKTSMNWQGEVKVMAVYLKEIH